MLREQGNKDSNGEHRIVVNFFGNRGMSHFISGGKEQDLQKGIRYPLGDQV